MTENFSLSDVAAVTRNNGYGDGSFGENWMIWLFALLMLNNNGGFFGNRNGEPVTEAALCNANSFNELKGSVGRLNDQVNGVNMNISNAVCQLGYETLRNFAGIEQTISSCCCETKQLLMENRYLAERNASDINANTTAQVQKVLDAICGNRIADMQNQINQLQLQSALCGVVRYPQMTTYTAGYSPCFNGGYGNGGCNYGCGNI